ncbi:Required for respiratory growth protein 9 mitochondrial [Cladophialophora chaetospira]|uniref:Required for respiratory growth protein 9, mitochondrial n=1 Tax=Cladophialophora chaetospira TaxID=386627 RepID=A0AA38X761_9EURO|nr:Required for respiratory growth protein 9 mitochondrial [Cladophialophora chaetospira]
MTIIDGPNPTNAEKREQSLNIDGQEGDGGIIITSNKQTLRDKQGRPWTKNTPSTGEGAGAHVVGVGVSIPAAPKRKKKPRIELRDLAVKPKKKAREPWQAQKGALENKFGDEGWNPRKRLSPDAMEGIRALHEEDPERWSTPVLAEHFKVSPEAIRRILKSKWKPKDDLESQKRKERWARRHDRIWDHQAELGLRPPREKDRAVADPETFDEEMRAKEMLDIARRA